MFDWYPTLREALQKAEADHQAVLEALAAQLEKNVLTEELYRLSVTAAGLQYYLAVERLKTTLDIKHVRNLV